MTHHQGPVILARMKLPSPSENFANSRRTGRCGKNNARNGRLVNAPKKRSGVPKLYGDGKKKRSDSGDSAKLTSEPSGLRNKKRRGMRERRKFDNAKIVNADRDSDGGLGRGQLTGR